MDRRDFLRRAALLAAGAVAADQLDLIERLGWRRKFFAGWSAPERTWLTPPLEHAGLYRITAIETSLYSDRPNTMTVSLLGDVGSGAVVLDASAAESRRLTSQFRAGDWVRISGDWGDWSTMGKSLLDS